MAIDQDAVAISEAQKNLKNFSKRIDFAQKNFSELGLLVRFWKVSHIDGILFDLGVSTYQLKSPERGFSFSSNAKLDMRMAPEAQTLSADTIVNKWSESDLRKILREFGQEPFAGKIAQEIVKMRKTREIETTGELVEVIRRALPPKYRINLKKHFATSTFRALRMVVNQELKNLEEGLKQAWQILSPGGRMVVISFHSLEDRIVKNFFRTRQNIKILTPKPVMAGSIEIEKNPSARSAKLRTAEKIG